MTDIIRPKERDAVLQSLRSGVVPRTGLRHVQVGRAREVEEVVKDVRRLRDGGAAFRIVVGDYGSGKTFFLHLARTVALEQKLVTVHADLSPDRRLHATTGQARALCAELMRNMSTRTRPDGNALQAVFERFIAEARASAENSGRTTVEIINERLSGLREHVGGFDFAHVVGRWAAAFEDGDDETAAAAQRWLRAEYALKSEARERLGVRTIVDDAGVHDHLKLLSHFVRLAGYEGLLVILDEMVNLHKLQNAQARTANYEQVLRILNDVLQGSAEHFGVFMGGTPEFLADPRRGLYSYEALRSRLAENAFAKGGLLDLSGPVLRLQNLTREDLFVLLAKLRLVHAGGNPANLAIPDEALVAFLRHSEERLGEGSFRTPRTSIKAFLDMLAIMDQNPHADWKALIAGTSLTQDRPPATADIEETMPILAGPSGAPTRSVKAPVSAEASLLPAGGPLQSGAVTAAVPVQASVGQPQPADADADDNDFASFRI